MLIFLWNIKVFHNEAVTHLFHIVYSLFIHHIHSIFSFAFQDLDFSACSGNSLVGELILLHISTRCRNLRSLDISWSNVSDIGIQAVCESVTR